MESSVIGPISIALSTVFVAFINWRANKAIKKMELDRQDLNKKVAELHADREELQKAFKALGLVNELKFVNIVMEKMELLKRNTKVDRVLIFFGCNGITEIRYANCILSIPTNDPATGEPYAKKYNNVKLDRAYKNMINHVKETGMIALHTETMEDQLLKDFYIEEKVYHSNLYFLFDTWMDEENKVVFYTSFATHQKEPFTRSEHIQMHTIVDGMIGEGNKLFNDNKLK